MLRSIRVWGLAVLMSGIVIGCDGGPTFDVNVIVKDDFDRLAIRSAYLVASGAENWQGERAITGDKRDQLIAQGWKYTFHYHAELDDLAGAHFVLKVTAYDDKRNLLAFGRGEADNGAAVDIVVQAAME